LINANRCINKQIEKESGISPVWVKSRINILNYIKSVPVSFRDEKSTHPGQGTQEGFFSV
jgi:hypothetical protein